MDAFETLGVERELEISEEELREAFREAGKRVHPDAGGSEREFGELQQAFGMLLSPSKRLRHWLELQGIEVEGRGSVSGVVSGLFGAVGEVIQAAGEVGRRKNAASSALALAMLEEEVQRTREAVEHAIERVEAALGAECGEFAGFQAAAGSEEAVSGLTAGMSDDVAAKACESVRTLAFLEKWRAELRVCYANLAA